MQDDDNCCVGRRTILTAGVLTGVVGLAAGIIPTEAAASLGKVRRDSMTPDQIIQEMLNGSRRFVDGQRLQRDWLAEQKATASGQYPAGIFLTCIDSRAPVEVVCDLSIGDAFNARVAGNAVNDDILGSMEYATEVSGAKVVIVMGHTGCGAISGAIDGVALGNLTLLLARIRNTIAATEYEGDRTTRNPEFVNLVAKNHVLATINLIRERSPLMAERERAGKIKIAGAMYDVKTGLVSLV